MVSRCLGLMGVASTLILLTYPVLAEDGWSGYGTGDRVNRPHHSHHRHHRDWRPETTGGGYGVPIIIPHRGTYAGDISVLRVRGVGTYFYAQRLGSAVDARDLPVESAPTSKMIDVRKRQNPCSYEAGVCVIRP